MDRPQNKNNKTIHFILLIYFIIIFHCKRNHQCDLNHSIFLTKKSIDLNHDWNQWFKWHWFKSANPADR